MPADRDPAPPSAAVEATERPERVELPGGWTVRWNGALRASATLRGPLGQSVPMRGDEAMAFVAATVGKINALEDALAAREPPEPAGATSDAVRIAAQAVLKSLDDLMGESEGVYGLHLNGDPAPWSTLIEGGEFEAWLLPIENLRTALADPARPPGAAPAALLDPGQDAVALDARAEDEADYAHKLQVALTGLAGGGSENFVRHGDGYRADIPFCTTKVRQRFESSEQRFREQFKARAAAEARIAALEAAGRVGVPAELSQAAKLAPPGPYWIDGDKADIWTGENMGRVMLARCSTGDHWQRVATFLTLAANDAFARVASGRDGVNAELSQAARDVLAERRRQVEAEGWTPEHDDSAEALGQMASAAACYAFGKQLWVGEENGHGFLRKAATIWPWAERFWKPRSQRENLVRAGALILADIERLDRARVASGRRAADGEG